MEPTHGAGAGPALTWGLCVATLNRIDVLEACVGLALGQTRPPAEVVVCDASADWEANRGRIAALMAAHPRLPFAYLPAPRRSLTVQRNAAVARARADVLFLIDDDSLMHPDCAEAIMRVYEADREGRIAAVAASPVGWSPLRREAPPGAPRERPRPARLVRLTQRSRLAGFVAKEVLMMAPERRLVGYDRARRHKGPEDFKALAIPGTAFTPLIPGFALTVRRSVATLEPFDDGLLAYCAAEDLDATYRFSRHGLNVQARDARLFHVETPLNRLGRRTVMTMTLANVAYFVRKNSDSFRWHCFLYYVHLARTAFAGLLTDVLNARWTFPHLTGALRAVPLSLSIFRQTRHSLQPWHEDRQRALIYGAGAPEAGT